MIRGKGTAKRASAAKEATARAMRAGWVRDRRPTRHTAWATIATTAGASPANSPVMTCGRTEGEVEGGQAQQGDYTGEHE
jgi:hypothetical protein